MAGKNRLDAFHISANFPGRRIILFGEAIKTVNGEKHSDGYVSTVVKFPEGFQTLEIAVLGTPVHETYVSTGEPVFEDARFLFGKSKPVAEINLLYERLGEPPADFDVFQVEGEPLLSMDEAVEEEYEELERSMWRHPLFMQTLQFYSSFLRKGVAAMKRPEYRAARSALVDMSHEMRNKGPLDPDKYELQERVSTGFKTLVVDILSESN